MREQAQEVSEAPGGDSSTSKSIAVTDEDANAIDGDAQALGQSAFAAHQHLQDQLQKQTTLTEPSEPLSTSEATRSSQPVAKLEDDEEMLRTASTAQAPGRWASMFRRSKDKK